MQIESSIQSQIAITLMPKLNSGLYLPLIERCGGIEGYFLEQEKALQTIYRELNLPAQLINRKKALQEAEKELSLIEKHQIHICSIEHHTYPYLLKQCEDHPLVFYYKGTLPTPESNRYLAIVGTRHASIRYQEKVSSTVEELCRLDPQLIIVSGLAYGIDGSAHRACLKCGLKTLAVLGHGLHMIYPASHKKLAEQILKSGGALISEFPCTVQTYPSNFLQRNRIIAGLCHATLIAESAQKGGAMATAHFALSYNREVMAFPGRFDDTYSAGCNRLIKENTAALVENSRDIAQILGISLQKPKKTEKPLSLFDLQQEDQLNAIFCALQKEGESSIDELIHLTNIPQSELSALLLQLELEGEVLNLPGKRYCFNKRN